MREIPFAVSLRFSGTMVPDFKDLVVRALIDRERPSWLKVVHLRTNSTGHTIRMSFKIFNEERDSVASLIQAARRKQHPCGDGVITITSISSALYT